MFQKSDDGRRCSWAGELDQVEVVVNQMQAWREGQATPAGPALCHAGPATGAAMGWELGLDWPVGWLARPSPGRGPSRRGDGE